MPQSLFKYLTAEFANDMVTKGSIQIGTLSYYRDIEDQARADRNEGKLSKSTTFKEEKTISNKEEFERDLPFLKGSNINNVRGTVKMPLGSGFSTQEDIPDSFIYCTSEKHSKDLLAKFKADVCVEIFNVQLFLDILSDELLRRKMTYPFTASGRKIEYIGHDHDHNIKLSGNWLKDNIFSEESEFRFCLIPVYHKDGKQIEPVRHPDKSLTFPTDHDPLDLKPFVIRRKEICHCCRIIPT